MDENVVIELKQLFEEMESCLKKAKELIENSNSSSKELKKKLEILVAVDKKGGVISKDQWQEIGKRYGMDPRGLGGFFVGDGSMVRIGGEQRALTERGKRMVEKWRKSQEEKAG